MTAVIADRHPPELHLFKNYVNPIDRIVPPENRLNNKYSPPPKPNGTLSLIPRWLVKYPPYCSIPPKGLLMETTVSI